MTQVRKVTVTMTLTQPDDLHVSSTEFTSWVSSALAQYKQGSVLQQALFTVESTRDESVPIHRQLHAFAKGKRDRSIAILGVLNRREEQLIHDLNTVTDMVRTAPMGIKRMLHASERHGMAQLEELQAVIELVRAYPEG
jgi:hypothetical protein